MLQKDDMTRKATGIFPYKPRCTLRSINVMTSGTPADSVSLTPGAHDIDLQVNGQSYL